jgi:hypothetical protein
MNRGCLVLAGIGLVSYFAFGVTLEAIDDPQELSVLRCAISVRDFCPGTNSDFCCFFKSRNEPWVLGYFKS